MSTFRLPQEDSNENIENFEQTATNKTLSEVYKKNINGLQGSKIIVAILDGVPVDTGTAFEVGYAFSRDIPVLGGRSDFRTFGELLRVDLMIQKACLELIFANDRSMAELAEQIMSFYKKF